MRTPVTLAIATFNQERYAAEAVRAALAQDAGELEILVSDDASSDATVSVVHDVLRGYRGRHVVRVNVNPVNLGIGAHVNRIAQLSRGKLIVGAAGDDVSEPHRVSRLLSEWQARGAGMQCLYSSVTRISSRGHLLGRAVIRSHDRFEDLRYLSRHGGWVLGASLAWARGLFERFGPLEGTLPCEDWAIPFRAALSDGVVFVNEPLVRYRVGTSSWRPAVDGREEARRALQLQMCSMRAAIATQALADVDKVGASAIRQLVLARLVEDSGLLSLCLDQAPSLASMIRTWRGGCRIRSIVALMMQRHHPSALSFVQHFRDFVGDLGARA